MCKKRVLAKLNGTQKALSNRPCPFLVHLEQELIKEYSDILRLEEEFWALKSRLNWAAYGDRSTSFFHATTLVKRHRNRIRIIKNSYGEWIADEGEIKNLILAGYRELFETNLPYSSLHSEIDNFSCCFLFEAEKEILSALITEEEIKLELWALKPFKAPELDGLHAGFFQIF